VSILGDGFMGSQFLQPYLIVMVETRFVIINKHRGRDVHGIDQDEAFLDAALPQTFVDFRGNIDQGPSGWDLEEQLFTIAFHD
jgi:hypothetical protein